jgi:hypothetical protein
MLSMTNRLTIAFCLLLAGCGHEPASSPTAGPGAAPISENVRAGGQPHAPTPLPPADELLITFRPGTPEARRQAIHQSVGCRVLGQMLSGRITHVKLPPGRTLAEAQSAYAKFPEVEAAEPNAPVQVQGHDTPTR